MKILKRLIPWRLLYYLGALLKWLTLISLVQSIKTRPKAAVLTALTLEQMRHSFILRSDLDMRGTFDCCSNNDRTQDLRDLIYSTSNCVLPWGKHKKALKKLGLVEVTSYPLVPKIRIIVTAAKAKKLSKAQLKAENERFKVYGLTRLTFREKVQGLRAGKLARDHVVKRLATEQILLKLVRTRLAPSFDKPISLHFHPRDFDDDRLNIVLWSKLNEPSEGTLCGVKTRKIVGNHTVRSSSLQFTEEKSQRLIGELREDGRVLYIFPSIGTAALEGEEMLLLDRVLMQIAEQLNVRKMVESVVREVLVNEDTDTVANCLQSIDNSDAISTKGIDGRIRRTICYLSAALLGPILTGKKIKLAFNQTPDAAGENEFLVNFNCSPRANSKASVSIPPTLFGIPTANVCGSAYAISGQGRVIFDDAAFPVAEYANSTLYTLLPIFKNGSRLEAILLARVYQELALLIKAEENGSWRDLEMAKLGALSETLLAAAPQPGEVPSAEALTEAENKLNAVHAQVLNAKVGYLRNLETASLEFGAEFDQLITIRKVLNLHVSDRDMTICTDLIYCVNPKTGKTHEIGAFKIIIPFDIDNVKIKWLNQTRKVAAASDGYNAPHVNADGHACLGNIEKLLPSLIRKREFVSVIELVIAFLESVNPSDQWGKYIVRWPEVGCDTPQETQGEQQ